MLNRVLKLAFILTLLLAVVRSTHADWSFYEKSNLKGTVSGTIQKDHIFELDSGSIYQVSEITIQIVVAIKPEALVLQDGDQFKLIIKDFKDSLLCTQLKPPASRSEKSINRTQSAEARFEELFPEDVQRDAGLQKLTSREKAKLKEHVVALLTTSRSMGTNEAGTTTSSTPTVIESVVDGETEGFEGETIFKLANGQIWQQAEYYYNYHYAYGPKVLIISDGTAYKMRLDGIDRTVKVKRLK
jgi:hypothetical protein